MTSSSAWIQAEVHFKQPGQDLGNQQVKQLQARGQVWFDGAWLHLRRHGDAETVSVPASAVDRVEWSPDR
jgi:hypothetical protein